MGRFRLLNKPAYVCWRIGFNFLRYLTDSHNTFASSVSFAVRIIVSSDAAATLDPDDLTAFRAVSLSVAILHALSEVLAPNGGRDGLLSASGELHSSLLSA